MEASTEETGEDKKPEIKCEPKEEKQGKETTDESSSNTESKKKSRNTHTHTRPMLLRNIVYCFFV